MFTTSQLRYLAETELNIPAPLHDYQWEGVSFLYRSHSALLADEMGLGKTVQTVVALALLLNGKSEVDRALIVAPASLTTNWVEELTTWTPSVTAWRVQGSAQDRAAFYQLPIPVLVSSYEQIRSDGLDRIPSGTFDLVILDEAQRIKNGNSATALGCQVLPRKRAWALSATPLENNNDDVVSILNFLDPPIDRNVAKKFLIGKLESIMLRRKKTEVRAELPPVIIQDLKLDLSAYQREKYNQLWENRVNAISSNPAYRDIGTALLGMITRLKIICNFDRQMNVSSKLDALEEIIEGAGKAARILVISQFVETLRWISDKIKVPHNFLTGSMSLTERHSSIHRFKSEKSPQLLLLSLRAGGVGLNLGEATHVVMFDRWWNPAVEVQAIYRAHRFERDEPLHVIRFLITSSIEEKISNILERKGALFNDVIDSVQTTSEQFTKRELMQILEISDRDISVEINEKWENENHG